MGQLQHIQHQISAINDLIKLNNDRIAGYEKSIEGTGDAKLRDVFEIYIEQSKDNVDELKELILSFGGAPAGGTSLAGKFHHTWIDIKSKLTGRDDKSILAECETGEEGALKAYRAALDDKELIWEDKKVVSVLTAHLKGLKTAYDNITGLREAVVSS